MITWEWQEESAAGFAVALPGVTIGQGTVPPGRIALLMDNGGGGCVIVGTVGEIKRCLCATARRIEAAEDHMRAAGPADGEVTSVE